MISGRASEILAHIDNGYVPGMFMAAYKVTTSGGTSRITRDSSHDIPSNNIDMTSIHFEASQIPGSEFEPGGVIAAHLKFDILNIQSVPIITTYKYATHASELDYVYRMVIVYNNTNYLYGPCFVATFIRSRYGQKTNIEFDEVLHILEHRNCDVVGYRSDNLKAIASYIMQDAGLFGFDTSEIYPGSNYYNENQINARQALSYILQINGLFMRSDAYGDTSSFSYIAKPLVNTSMSLNLLRKYVFNYDYDTEYGQFAGAWVYEKGADHPTAPFNIYLIDNNPFIVYGNRESYRTILNANIIGANRQGFVFTVPMLPIFELGDFVRINYNLGPSSYGSADIIVSRIEWDGGMFMKITEASFEGNR